jgi:hypothetical protein
MGSPGQRADLNLHQPLGGEGDHLDHSTRPPRPVAPNLRES